MKKAKKTTTAKKTTAKTTALTRRGVAQARLDMITNLVMEGKYSRQQILEKVYDAFKDRGISKSTIATDLSDSKNPTYCRLRDAAGNQVITKEVDGVFVVAKTA
jgi:hypothetical protein